MFGGMWESETTLDASWLSGRPQLAIGHFGPELTGIVRFRDEDLIPRPVCGCAYLDQVDVDLTNQRFIATNELCDTPPTVLIWDLTLEDQGADPRLVGEVRRANDDTSPAVMVSFRLDDRFVPDDRRELCDR